MQPCLGFMGSSAQLPHLILDPGVGGQRLVWPGPGRPPGGASRLAGSSWHLGGVDRSLLGWDSAGGCRAPQQHDSAYPVLTSGLRSLHLTARDGQGGHGAGGWLLTSAHLAGELLR